MRLTVSFLLILQFMSSKSAIQYHVSFPNAAAHYVHIIISMDVKANEQIVAKMPVWTPGSYKIREFSQHVDRFYAVQKDTNLIVDRRDKNSWIVSAIKDGKVDIHYDVYAFELGVRTSYVDLNKAFLHGVSAFMYLEGFENQPITLNASPLKSWESMYVAIKPEHEKPWTYTFSNYDLLADSPMAFGNFETVDYESGGTPHKVVMIGKGNYDLQKIKADFKKISDEVVRIFGEKHPSEVYIHFIQNVDVGGGGLEHLNCQTSQVNRWAYSDEKKYLSFLGLVAHEYFHLWNVKRLRPIELGPFDYDKENYTEMLWIAEGITSYFDDLVLLRTGLHTQESYFEVIASSINRFENMPGKAVMNLAESSKLAWVKGYYSNENSDNVTVSYYNKGMLVAWLLDLEIMRLTNGEKRLDDVMLKMYQDSQNTERGFTFSEFIQTCNHIVGKDFTDFFVRYIRTTEPLPYSNYLKDLGLNLVNKTDIKKVDLGMKIKSDGGKTIIAYIHPTGPAIKAGLSVNDEILAIDGWRVTGDMSAEISRLAPDKQIEILFSRDGVVSKTELSPISDLRFDYKLVEQDKPIKSQEVRRKLWLKVY